MEHTATPSDPMAQWRDLVGGFILAFGDIELISFRLWREHIGTGSVPYNFKVRTERVLEVLRPLGDSKADLVKLLEAALVLADRRNTVAHHPMQVQVFQHSATGELFFENAIASEINSDYITDDDLKELRAEAEGLVADLYIKLGFMSPSPRAA